MSEALSEGTKDEPEAPPPVLGSWRNVYLLLAGQLLVVVAVLYAVTRWAS